MLIEPPAPPTCDRLAALALPYENICYEARLDAAILVPIKRVTGRPGRKGTAQVWACKGTAQVWARRDLEEGKGSRAQGEEEYG